jgi:hypothetical protein
VQAKLAGLRQRAETMIRLPAAEAGRLTNAFLGQGTLDA